MSKDAKAAQTDDDELPWDIEETYETLMKAIQAKRETTAEKWLADNVPAKKNISALEAREAQRLLTVLQSSPARGERALTPALPLFYSPFLSP